MKDLQIFVTIGSYKVSAQKVRDFPGKSKRAFGGSHASPEK